MIYNEHMGIIYDVILYGLIYFNKSSLIKKFEERGHDLDGAFTYFDEVKNSCPPLPECLLPFFYYDSITPCFLTEYIIKSLDFHKHKFQDFIKSLQNPLKKNVFDYLFENLSDDEKMLLIKNKDSKVVIKAFTNESWSGEMTKQTMFLLYNFSYVSYLLIDTINDIYKHISELHNKYIDKIAQKVKETQSKETLLLFEKLYSLDEKKASMQICSICFMNQFVRYEKRDGNVESVFLLGYRYKETMETDYNKANVSLEKALFAIGDPIRFKIIVNLKKHGSLTISDLGRLINISKTTSFRHINILCEEKIIIEHHREGLKIYYKVNKDYLFSMEKLFSKFVNE